MSALAWSNPFAASRVRPGAMPYLFPPGGSAAALLAAWRAAGRRGQIVGPHGTGKSTLLATLVPLLEQMGEAPLRVTLREDQRLLPDDVRHRLLHAPPGTLVVDSFECLSWWNRFWVRGITRRRGWGLLVTVHGTAWLPTLLRMRITPALAQRVLAHLLAEQPSPWVGAADLASALTRRHGNLRAALFDLYDLHETRRREVHRCRSS